MIDSTCISSFVIRIIKEADPRLAGSPYRGIIRHVQSDQELSFTNWTDVERFIQHFVPIHRMNTVNDGSCNDLDTKEIKGTVQS
jgi:hypothetical protein